MKVWPSLGNYIHVYVLETLVLEHASIGKLRQHIKKLLCCMSVLALALAAFTSELA